MVWVSISDPGIETLTLIVVLVISSLGLVQNAVWAIPVLSDIT